MWRYILETADVKMDFRESFSILIKHDVVANGLIL